MHYPNGTTVRYNTTSPHRKRDVHNKNHRHSHDYAQHHRLALARRERLRRKRIAELSECEQTCVDEAAARAAVYLASNHSRTLFVQLRKSTPVHVSNRPKHSGRVYLLRLSTTALDELKSVIAAHNQDKPPQQQWKLIESEETRRRAESKLYLLAPDSTSSVEADQFAASLPVEQINVVEEESQPSSTTTPNSVPNPTTDSTNDVSRTVADGDVSSAFVNQLALMSLFFSMIVYLC